MSKTQSFADSKVVLAKAAMVRYARSGDAQDFAELYGLLYPRLFRYCVRLCGPSDAEELVQEVFLKMHLARTRFDDDAQGGVASWAFTIARRTHFDRMRWRKRRPETSVDPIQLENAAAVGRHPESVLAARAIEGRFQYALSSLSDNARSAFVLVRLQGLSSAAASDALGVSVDALKQRVHRASEELKTAMLSIGEGVCARAS
jgi:RNA polymerase sigma-70 factor (ECF subfamily)